MKVILTKNHKDSQIIVNKILELLDNNQITYKISDEEKTDEVSLLFNTKVTASNKTMTVPLLNKGFKKIVLQDIRYITTKGRNTVVQLSNDKIETKHSISHWQNTLDQSIFAIPHNSYIVNLNYVVEVSKEVVIVSDNKNTYSIYPSQRKYCSFKKAFINFKRD